MEQFGGSLALDLIAFNKAPQTIGWLKKLELWVISILRNQASRP